MTTKQPNRKCLSDGHAATGVPQRVIRRFARRVAEQFHPDKIILFGSHAYGEPNADSDVDILVVMPARNQLDQAAKIRLAVQAPFSMDLIVRTPSRVKKGIQDGESFTREIMSKGKILYEGNNNQVGAEGRGRLGHRQAKQRKRNAPT